MKSTSYFEEQSLWYPVIAVRIQEGDKHVTKWYALQANSKEISASLCEKAVQASEAPNPWHTIYMY